MKIILSVGIGSFIGGVGRYLISKVMVLIISSVFPWATLLVNITGCFLIGLVYAFFANNRLNEDWKLFLATGVLGGFTTFSAFSMETFTLFREGHNSYALLYITGSIVLGLLATFLGYTFVKN